MDLLLLTAASPDPQVQSLRTELLNVCNERDMTDQRVQQLCSAMQKERVALHSVLPSARKAIEDIETKKRAIEVQLAATQEELRRVKQSRVRGMAHQLDGIKREHHNMLHDTCETLKRLGTLDESPVVDAATSKFKAFRQGLLWLQEQLAECSTEHEEAPSIQTEVGVEKPLPQFVEQLQRELQEVRERASQYQAELELSRASELRLQMQIERQQIQIEDLKGQGQALRHEPLSPETPPRQVIGLPRLHLPSSTQSRSPVGIYDEQPDSPRSEYSDASFDVEARVQQILASGDDASGRISPASVASDASLLRDIEGFTAEFSASLRHSPNSHQAYRNTKLNSHDKEL